MRNGTWNLTPENHPGDVQMRTENLIHRVTLLKREVAILEALRPPFNEANKPDSDLRDAASPTEKASSGVFSLRYP